MAKEKLSDVAYLEIRKLIQDGSYGPGTVLPEIELSQKLGISRTPIREALLRLERDTIVTIIPRVGATVSTFDLNQMTDLYELRGIIESKMAELVSEPNVDVEPFCKIKQEYLDAFNINEDGARFLLLDQITANFKILFVKSCRNKMLCDQYLSINRRTDAMFKITHVLPQFPDLSSRERMGIIDAIINKQAKKASELTEQYVKNCLKRILSSIMPKA